MILQRKFLENTFFLVSWGESGRVIKDTACELKRGEKCFKERKNNDTDHLQVKRHKKNTETHVFLDFY